MGNSFYPKKRNGFFSYVLVAIIAAIIGGLITPYLAPSLYGKILPMPKGIETQPSKKTEQINITPQDSISNVSAVAQKSISSVVGITTVEVVREFIWERPVEGVGSGVIVDSNGYILTNSHVIGDGKAKELNVLFESGDKMPGKVLWSDPALDLAIVKVDKTGLPAADLGDSDSLEVGELAVAIGNPLGLDFQRTVTSGVISGLNRSIKIDEINVIEDLIQTDASINPGNSGGPLLNNKGEVIGINTAKIQTGEGLGFAIPINTVKPIVDEVIEHGEFKNVYIGIEGMDIKVYERRENKELNVDSGVVVENIIPNSPAAEAGLKSQDIILSTDGNSVESMIGLRKILYNYTIGDKAVLKINRNGKEMDLEVKFKEF